MYFLKTHYTILILILSAIVFFQLVIHEEGVTKFADKTDAAKVGWLRKY